MTNEHLLDVESTERSVLNDLVQGTPADPGSFTEMARKDRDAGLSRPAGSVIRRPSQLSQVHVYLGVALVLGVLFYVAGEYPDHMPSQIRWVPLIPLAIGLKTWAETYWTVYRLEAERLVVERGILIRRTDELMLFRVQDSRVVRGVLRLVRLGDVHVMSSDVSDPVLKIRAIPDPEAFQRLLSERATQQRREQRTGLLEAV